MATVNKPGKPRRGKCQTRRVPNTSPQDGPVLPAVVPQRTEEPVDPMVLVEQADQAMDLAVKFVQLDELGLSPLHVACLYGQLGTVQQLIESRLWWIDSVDAPQHYRPIHMVLSGRSAPRTYACLKYLLEQGATINVTTDYGQTPLHLAASQGLLDCTKVLVEAGADMTALDNQGCSPMDMARFWCHRALARYLNDKMWKKNKKEEGVERKQVQVLYHELVDMANLNKRALIKEKIAERPKRTGLPKIKKDLPRVLVSQKYIQYLPSEQDTSKPEPDRSQYEYQPWRLPEDEHVASKLSPAPRPWTIYSSLRPDRPLTEPKLQDKVLVWRGRISERPQYATRWNTIPQAAPNLPLDTIERVLFPKSFYSRIGSLIDYESQGIIYVQHRAYPQGQSDSPWTEVAMHLAEVLEPGHY